MNYHRWSALFRSYDLTLRHNQLILLLTVAGAALAFVAGQMAVSWSSLYRAVLGGIIVFAAGALAKEVDPDRQRASLLAAVLALGAVWAADPASPLALLWLGGSLRFLNRTTGLRPLPTDTVALLGLTAWLSWRELPLFGLLFGALLMLDAVLPDGQRWHMWLGAALLIGAAVWLWLGDWTIEPLPAWLILALLAVATGFIAVILNSYAVQAVGDATGQRLNSSRVQAGQVFALAAGLALASWRGEAGVALFVALWAALLGVLAYFLFFGRLRHSVPTV
mgnify:CR=1 FL=1